jgi:hypothetical protein
LGGTLELGGIGVELTDCGDGEAGRGADGMETKWAAGCGGERAEGCAADCVGEDHCCVRGTGDWGWMGAARGAQTQRTASRWG